MSKTPNSESVRSFAIRRSTWPTTLFAIYLLVLGVLCLWFATETLDANWHDDTTRSFGKLLNALPPLLRFGIMVLFTLIFLLLGASMLADVVKRIPVLLLDPSGVTWTRFTLFPLKTSWDKVQWVEGSRLVLDLDSREFSMAYLFVDVSRDQARSEFAHFMAKTASRMPDIAPHEAPTS